MAHGFILYRNVTNACYMPGTGYRFDHQGERLLLLNVLL